MKSINPATGEVLAQFEEHSLSEVKELLRSTQKAQQKWSSTDFLERTKLFKALAQELVSRIDELSQLITSEMGKPLKQAQAEIEKCAKLCHYYAQTGPEFLKDEVVETDAQHSFVSFRPLGIVLAVMPWNFPFWQAFRCAIPSMMAGNGLVLKHASNVTGCALKMEELFLSAGFPQRLFTVLKVSGKEMDAVIEQPEISAISLTGSTPAGRAVAKKAGEVLKKCVLELGGSDAYIVLEDADLKKAAKILAEGRLQNTGQSCIAAKRFLVVQEIYEPFLELFAAEIKGYNFGDPMEESSKMGPMARVDLRQELHEQVQKSVAQGARLIFGGECPEGKGAYYPATLLAEVIPGMPAFDEELFGPVAAVVRVKDEAQAIDLANKTKFGLGAGVFTENLKRGAEIAAHKLEAGSCFVNAYVKSDPRLPFGGIKDSGYGRELGLYGIREFVNTKTVYIS